MSNFKALAICFLFVEMVSGQQLPQFSQYIRNQYMINPGAAGVYGFADITVAGRSQWTGATNAPQTTYASFTQQLPIQPRQVFNPGLRMSTGPSPVKNPEIKTGKLVHGIGGQFIADQYGAFRKIDLNASYAVHLPLSKDYMLSFGTRVGYSNSAFLQDRAIVKNSATDLAYTDYLSNGANTNNINIGTGLYLYSKQLFFGVAVDNMTKDYVSFGASHVNIDTRMHATFTGGYKVAVNENLSVTPAFLLKTMYPVPLTVEGTIQFEYKEWVWGGISYRNKDAIILMAGANISQKIKVGYSYDITTSPIKNYSSGSHELVLGIMLR
jgi:type IX secretion system PorP/SprF family membrane protein